MAKKKRETFLTSLPGILTALGTLVAACAGLIALFISTSGRQISSSSSTNTVPTISQEGDHVAGVSNHTSSNGGNGIGPGVVTSGGPSGDSGSTPGERPTGGSVSSGAPGKSPGGRAGGGGGSSGGPSSGSGGSPGPAVSGVAFTGNTAAPTVTITGDGFGDTAPAGQLDNSTSCGNYTNNGYDYGPTDLWFEDVGNFAAGSGFPPNGSCIGIIVLSWSPDRVTYMFGNAYASFDHWYISTGDQYVVWVKGIQYSGTVTFTS